MFSCFFLFCFCPHFSYFSAACRSSLVAVPLFVYSRRLNLSVFDVQGTHAKKFYDWFTDLDIWLEIALFQIIDVVLPGLKLWPQDPLALVGARNFSLNNSELILVTKRPGSARHLEHSSVLGLEQHPSSLPCAQYFYSLPIKQTVANLDSLFLFFVRFLTCIPFFLSGWV